MKTNVIRLLVCLSIVFTLLVSVVAEPLSAASQNRTQRRPVNTQAIRRTAERQVSQNEISVIKQGNLNTGRKASQVTAATLNNGNIFIAWEDLAPIAGQQNEGAAGYVLMFNQQMQQLGTSIIYTPARQSFSLGDNKAVSFANNNILIVYIDKEDGGKGKFVIFNPQTKRIYGPTVFNDTQTEWISLTKEAGSNAALIAFHKKTGQTGSGKLLVVNSSGRILIPVQTFNSLGLTSNISASLLPDGLMFLTFKTGFTYTKVIDPYCHIAVDGGRITGQFDPIETCTLGNGNILMVHSHGRYTIHNRNGDTIGQPVTLLAQGANKVMTTKMANGNIFLSAVDRDGKVSCFVLDNQGKIVKGPKALDKTTDPNVKTIAQTNFSGDRVLLVFGGRTPSYMILQ